MTIHRPAVVCGDSKTGETGKYDGVYYLIHYLLRWPSVLSMINIGNHKVSLNLVPVDFVVDAMAALAFDERAIGKTLQLADPAPLTTNQLFNAIAKSIDGHQSKITAPAKLVRFFLMLPPVATDHGPAAPRRPLLLRQTTLRHQPRRSNYLPPTASTALHSKPTSTASSTSPNDNTCRLRL